MVFYTSSILLHAWALDGNIEMLSRREGKEGIKENRPSGRSDRRLCVGCWDRSSAVTCRRKHGGLSRAPRPPSGTIDDLLHLHFPR